MNMNINRNIENVNKPSNDRIIWQRLTSCQIITVKLCMTCLSLTAFQRSHGLPQAAGQQQISHLA